MYAIIGVGGKQYIVKKNDIIEVEKIEVEDGKDVTINEVLMVAKNDDISVGTPHVKGAKVVAQIVKQFKGVKTVAYKYRRRKSSDWSKGHRQKLTRIKITEIVA